jgi:signal peptidase
MRRTIDLLLVGVIALVLVMLFLARGLPLLTGGTTFVVAGASMEPVIPMGSLVHVTPVPADDLRPGDVVSIQVGAAKAVFTHRIVRLATLPDGAYIETKGDANPSVDPSLVPVTSVIGRQAFSLPVAGFGLALLSSIQGVLFLAALSAMLLAGAWLLESIEDDQHAALRRRAAAAAAALAPIQPASESPTDSGAAA